MGQFNKYGEIEDSVCPNCGDPVKPEWKACPICAARLLQKESVCEKCEASMDPGWRACPECGTRVRQGNKDAHSVSKPQDLDEDRPKRLAVPVRIRVLSAIADLEHAVAEGEMKIERAYSRGISSMFCGFMDVVNISRLLQLVEEVWDAAGEEYSLFKYRGPFWRNVMLLKRLEQDHVVAQASAEVDYIRNRLGL